jgi:hypothetical protein
MKAVLNRPMGPDGVSNPLGLHTQAADILPGFTLPRLGRGCAEWMAHPLPFAAKSPKNARPKAIAFGFFTPHAKARG